MNELGECVKQCDGDVFDIHREEGGSAMTTYHLRLIIGDFFYDGSNNIIFHWGKAGQPTTHWKYVASIFVIWSCVLLA